MNLRVVGSAALVSGMTVIAACSTGEDPLAAELASASADTESLQTDLETAEEAALQAAQERDDAMSELRIRPSKADLDTIREDLIAAEERVDELSIEVDEATDTVDSLVAELEQVREESDLTRGERDALLLQYDDEIRAGLALEVDSGIQADCLVAVDDFRTPIDDVVSYDVRWDAITDETSFVESVGACASDDRAAAQAVAARAEFADSAETAGEWARQRVESEFSCDEGCAFSLPTLQPEQALALGESMCAEAALALIAIDESSEGDFEFEARLALCPEIQPVIDRGGTSLVGLGENEIAPGTWRSLPGVSDCYWERTRGDGDIIDNDFVSFAADGVTVRVDANDASVEFGCGPMAKVG